MDSEQSLTSHCSMRSSLAAAALSCAIVALSIGWQSTALGGADQYSYVTAAGLIGRGRLIVHQTIPQYTPWPGSDGTWTPIGYIEVPGALGAITPVVPPGLPLLMAVLQRLFGFCGAFWVVPMCAGLTVWCTFRLAMRLFARHDLALASAALIAVSPAFLAHCISPLSDVPATAGWLLAVLLLVDDRPIAAGISAAIAIAVRPNLVPIAVALLGWAALREGRGAHTRGLPSAVRMASTIAPAIVGIAWLNTHLFGSPIRSGYGELDRLYGWTHAATNVRQFATWAVETETPVLAMGAVFFFAPALLPQPRVARARLLLGAVIAIVIASYVFYLPFAGWVYLRFLLPAWPLVMILTAAGIDALAGRLVPARMRLAALAGGVCLLAVHHAWFLARQPVFARSRGEARYVDVARHLAATTDPSAVFISWQESGSIRLYADRLTINFARLDRGWLDRAVDRLHALGRHPYFVVEGFEIEVFRDRFGAFNRLGALDWPPIAVFQEPYVAIYDPYQREAARPPDVIPPARPRAAQWCAEPAVWPPRLNLP